jgi:hypothetical protein
MEALQSHLKRSRSLQKLKGQASRAKALDNPVTGFRQS